MSRKLLNFTLTQVLLSNANWLCIPANAAHQDLQGGAEAKYKLSDYDKASKECTAWLRSHPNDKDMLRLQGKCHLAQGAFDSAISDFESAGCVAGPLEQAMKNQSTLDVNDAEENAYPVWLQALVIMYAGRISAEQGSFERSLRFCDLALTKESCFPECIALRGNVLMKMNRLYESEEMYRQAISWRPRDWHMWMGYSSVLERQYKLAQSLEAINKALELIKTPPYQESDLNKKTEILTARRTQLEGRLRR